MRTFRLDFSACDILRHTFSMVKVVYIDLGALRLTTPIPSPDLTADLSTIGY